jgi:acyl carrier protein
MTAETLDTLKELLNEVAAIEPATVNRDSNFIDDLGFDSLDQIELLMSVEEVFDICVDDDAVETILTVGSAVDYIDAAKGAHK